MMSYFVIGDEAGLDWGAGGIDSDGGSCFDFDGLRKEEFFLLMEGDALVTV